MNHTKIKYNIIYIKQFLCTISVLAQTLLVEVNMPVPVTFYKAPPPWPNPPPVVFPKKAPPALKAAAPAWLVPPAPRPCPARQSAASVASAQLPSSSTSTSLYEVQPEVPSTTNEIQVLVQRVQDLEQVIQCLVHHVQILMSANAPPEAAIAHPPPPANPPPPAAAHPPHPDAPEADAATQTAPPPPPLGPPPEAPAAHRSGYNIQPPAGATRPLAICSTYGCNYNAHIDGFERGFAGFCCWYCYEIGHGRQPYQRHGKRCQRHKQTRFY
jgi:hypothetical protein